MRMVKWEFMERSIQIWPLSSDVADGLSPAGFGWSVGGSCDWAADPSGVAGSVCIFRREAGSFSVAVAGSAGFSVPPTLSEVGGAAWAGGLSSTLSL